MGVQSYSQEISSPVAPGRLFKALCLDSHNFLPKLVPETFKSVEFVHGDCVAVGAVKQINFSEGTTFKSVKHRVDELDVDKFYYKYTVTEGDVLGDKVEYVVNEVKFVASGSGSGCSFSNHYHSKEGAVLDEEKIKYGHEKLKGLFKKVEEYLVANPEVYA
uniref:Pathogenesis-related protein 10 n=1 Tax=Rheum australe TaxID=284363 RepID=B5M1X5_RHEAU|nr:pathogenesis-related protein 10 [Rheum australe]